MFRTSISNLIKRQLHGNAELIKNCKEIINRNPRNLERLRIARKPIGYALDNFDVGYWHTLNIRFSQRFVRAEICHFENGPVITVSSQEWGIRKQLYSTNDSVAAIFVAQVLAQRCLESGIYEIYVNNSIITGDRSQLLVDTLSKHGVCLQEPEVYRNPKPGYMHRPEKPWEIHE
ncbi:39S ribosomal protein L18, mitochondrial [Eufriesea mexicana]|uniref:Large ribosomal subunit protein uL18m n=1 Tax=Eufriesea mexicana TaxID=516756 RepID=A0A310SDY4_9HYME|nr:PREDICTED: 39S ribosomal protein L18, mitochondrial [Eufriesea mexicana]OAD52475.1 39S ribosomal protein L18, mitochondrial [Eufriesea mexicana]